MKLIGLQFSVVFIRAKCNSVCANKLLNLTLDVLDNNEQ